ncbi:MAG: hypothetical protein K2N91_04025 [Muribaculaceae bacterium]|nr:hypothetical protein [Muribaculaceae bacterium]
MLFHIFALKISELSANFIHIFDISKHLFDFFAFFMNNADTINDRICTLIDHEGLSIAAFARKINIGDQTVRAVCVLKRNKPSFEFITNIVQTYNWLNPKWLLTGEGSMTSTDTDDSSCKYKSTSFQNMRDLLAYMKEKDVETAEFLREKDKKIEELIVESTEWRMKFELSNQ